MMTLSFVVLLAVLAVVAMAMPARDAFPQIISHRGASGYIPEHSLQAYQLAIDLKTDYIEPDLCLSKAWVRIVTSIFFARSLFHRFLPFSVFVAMHDLLLDDTTQRSPLFRSSPIVITDCP